MSPESSFNRNEKRNPFESHDNESLITRSEATSSVIILQHIYDALDMRHADDPSDENKIALFTVKQRLEEIMLFAYLEESLNESSNRKQ